MTKLEKKFMEFDFKAGATGGTIEGYGSKFNILDHGGDIVMPGAYKKSLASLKAKARNVKMLWQHDPSQPIGVWDEVKEDANGLWVKGRILSEVKQGAEAIALLSAGAIDGLSIGYKTVDSERNAKGERLLKEVDVWEVSLVTFPMLPDARGALKGDGLDEIKQILEAGGRLTERQFEVLVKGLGLSNAQAERAARIHLKGQGEPANAENSGEELVAALLASFRG